jgi:7,8-dihydropterin-6-yl-methyl-4-(beta-D-ribofuranosyl)aminobenzene 5'-phosphate synthase
MTIETTPSVRITVLVEDRSSRGDLIAEHGLSLWVEADGLRILFDTGQSGAFLSNAHVLGVAAERPDALVLSHGHYDHTGGLPFLSGDHEPARLYLHPAAVTPRYSRRPSASPKPIGMPSASAAAINRMGRRVVWTNEPTRISDHVGVAGPIPRNTTYEDTGGPFFLDPQCSKPDRIIDDQALWIETPRGPVVVLGCAHAGVVNTLDHLAALLGATHFYAVVGGMHLLHANEERLDKTVRALKRYSVEVLAPCHCTGTAAINYLKDRLPDSFVRMAVGSELRL